MTGRAEAMSNESGTTVGIYLLNINEYHRVGLFVKFDQIKNPEIPLRNVSLSHVATLHGLLRMYAFDYTRGAL